MEIKTVRVTKDHRGEWRWAAFAANGEQVADSSEGYKSKRYAKTIATALHPGAVIKVDE